MNFCLNSYSEQYKKYLKLFITAIKKNDLQDAKEILTNHQEQLKHQSIPLNFDLINDTQLWGWSALHVAVYFGLDKMYMWLNSEGGCIEVKTTDGWNCLTLATSQGNQTVVTLLIGQSNIDINYICPKGTALHLAAQADFIQILQILLTHPKINLFLLNSKDQTPLDVCGKRTKPLMTEEISKHNSHYDQVQDKLLESFRSSMTNFMRFTQMSQNVVNHMHKFQSFMVNMPMRPPIIRGVVLKVGYFRIQTYERYMVIDPESGVLARYKCSEDHPYNPNELIALTEISEVVVSENKWFQRSDLFYLKISHNNNELFVAFRYENTMIQWLEFLLQSVGYAKYVEGKINRYIVDEQKKKAQRAIVQAMLEKANQDIIILDQTTFAQLETIPSLNLITNQKPSQESSESQLFQIRQQEIQTQEIIGIKHFDFLQLLGKGAFGNVYKVRCKLNGKIYALKQQDKEKLKKKHQVKYAQRELKVLKLISHPFLINVHCSFQTPRYLYLLLDLSSKGDLSMYITRGVILDELTTKFFVGEIILAISYLHDKNIIYRDLKPENVSLDENGHIKLIDFGLSKLGNKKDFLAMTFCGSSSYLSPEILKGEGATSATDVYTIGTILFEMLTGYPPHFSDRLEQLFNDIRFTTLKIPINLSKAARDLLGRMLDKSPIKRLKIEEIMKHIYFSEIDWVKLSQRKYIAPKLVQKFGSIKADDELACSNLHDLQLDQDYLTPDNRSNYLPGWDYN